MTQRSVEPVMAAYPRSRALQEDNEDDEYNEDDEEDDDR
jgi:hypothetical protein